MPQQSPLLDDYNNSGIITPALQRALDIAKQKLGPQFQLPQTAPTATPRFTPPGLQVPSISRANQSETPTPALTAPSAPAATATPSTPSITDPDATQHLTERDRLIKTGSGISQIHNPIGRGLLRAADVIGSAFVPRITAGIPGTELHHNYLVRQAEGTVDKDVARAKESAGTVETEQRAANEALAAPGQRARTEAETNEANARTKSLEGADKAEAKTITTDEGIFQWNPDTKRYDIPAGEAPGKHQENTHVLPDGSVIAVHNDPKTGKSTAEVLYQGKPAEKPGHVIQRIVKGKIHNILVDAETGKDRQDLGEGRQPTPADHGTTVIGPDGKVLRLEPGQTAPKGYVTPQQGGSLNVPTAQTRTMAETAPKVQELATRVGQLIDQQAASLGPAASRWAEFMSGKVGAPNAEFTKLRTDVGLLQTALMRMHVGARGGEQMMEHFRDLIDVAKQSPENLKAALGEIQEYAKQVAAEGKAKNGEAGDTGLPGGITLDEINAELERRKKK